MRNPKRYDGVDLTGQRHGRLTAIRKADFGRTQWVCKCDCGKEITIPACKLFILKSCGCLEKENLNIIKQSSLTHGMTDTRLYKTWCGIKARCYNPNTPHYERYGGRGIEMCAEWKDDFQTFANWALANGFDINSTGKEQSIDRIDPNGNYDPTNCRWASKLEQARNRCDSVNIEYLGERLPLAEYAMVSGVDRIYAFRASKRGLSGIEIKKEWDLLHNSSDKYMGTKEAATAFGVTSQTIKIWIHNGSIPYVRAASKFLIPREYVEKLTKQTG